MSGGECCHSLLGPHVGFHHSSLLIATLWPLGRGNLAYGCKVIMMHRGLGCYAELLLLLLSLYYMMNSDAAC